MSTTSSAGVIAYVLADYARTLRSSAANRAYTVGASDIGQCARKAFFVKHDGERDPGYVDTWGAVLRGQIIEQAFWVPALRARFGADLKFVGDRQRQFKRGFVSCTPDARHGHGAVHREHGNGTTAAECAPRTRTAVGAGLIVMGAYTHGHYRQFLFGGMTRHVMEHAAVPVLLAH